MTVVGMQVMQALGRVLVQMKSFYANTRRLSTGTVDDDLALADDGALVLRNLISGWQIGIKVILPVEHTHEIDFCFQTKPGTDGLLHALPINHRKHAGHGRVDKADLLIGLRTECRGRP